jgi:hypothetical protein
MIQANGPGWGESLARRRHNSLAAGLLQRTGIVILHGNDGSFIHETFREYLAASALAQTYSSNDAETLPLVMRWRDDRWREVLLFLLGIWAQGESGLQAVTVLVRQLWERCNRNISPEEIIALLDFLLDIRDNGIWLEAAAVAAIAEEAAPTLIALTRPKAKDSDKPTPTASRLHRLFGAQSISEQAVFLLTLFGRKQDVLSVGQDPLANDFVRIFALDLLAHSGWKDKVLPILLTIGRDAEGHDRLRLLAALRLKELGQSDEARSILLTLAKDPADSSERGMAARTLADYGWLDDVQILEPILHDSLNRGLFPSYVMALIKTGRISELPGLAADDDFGVSIREAIARQLDEIARDAKYEYRYPRSEEDYKPSLLAIARDQAVTSQIRRLAATAVAKRGEWDAAVPILRELLEKQKFDASERLATASALEELGHFDEVTPVLHELAQAVGVSSLVRMRACETLAKHERWAAVIPSALDIAKNRENDPPIRYGALILLNNAPDFIPDITTEEIGEIISLFREWNKQWFESISVKSGSTPAKCPKNAGS